MIREVKFESQDRRIKQIIAALNENGIKDIEEANAICEAAGLRPLPLLRIFALSTLVLLPSCGIFSISTGISRISSFTK